jgi:hypothetical protein
VQHPKIKNGSFTGATYYEGSKWNRNTYLKCNRNRNSKKYEDCANNTAYDKWQCVRMILKIIQ